MNARGTTSLATALLLSLGALEAPAAMTDRQKATVLVKPAIVYVEVKLTGAVEFEAGGKRQTSEALTATFSGSGFFINPEGFVVTNGHVVMPGNNVSQMYLRKFFNDQFAALQKQVGRELTQEEKLKVAAALKPRVVNLEGKAVQSNADLNRQVAVITKAGIQQQKEAKRSFSAEVRAFSPMSEKDIAILKISGRNYPTVKLGDSDRVKIQDAVTVLGYPGAVSDTFETGDTPAFGADSQMEPTITSGTISSFKTWQDGSPILGTDAATTHGNSGGPGINDRGEVIGVLSMGAEPEAGKQVFGFNFFRPINVEKDFIRSLGIQPQTSLTDTRFADGMRRFWRAEELVEAGKGSAARAEYEGAKSSLRSVLELYPQHPDAARYVVSCEEALARIPSGPNWSLFGWVAGGLLVVAGLAVGATILTRSAGKQRPAAAPGMPGPAPAARGAQPSSGFVIVAEKGAMAGNRFPVPAVGLMFGRDPGTAQIVLAGETISREHCKLQVVNGGLLLTNLSTTNPTYVNERPASQVAIKAGDRIQIGANVFLVTV